MVHHCLADHFGSVRTAETSSFLQTILSVAPLKPFKVCVSELGLGLDKGLGLGLGLV